MKSTEEKHNDFLAAFSHDLKSPIMSAKIALEGIIFHNKNFCNEKKCEQELKGIVHILEEILNLIKNFLTLYQVEGNRYIFNIEKVDVKKILKNEILIHKYLLREKKLKTITEFAQKNEIRACEESLKRIFSNLLSNAIKFAPKNSQITIKTQQNKNKFTIFFENLSEPLKENIFEKFVSNKNQKSTGMGLYIAKNLVERMGGTISSQYFDNKARFLIEFDY